jgi:hypothetical protein
MVGPISDAERASFNRKVIVVVTVLVGASAGLVALQAEAAPVEVAGVTAVGLVVGYLVARFVVPSGPAPATRQRQARERENPFADGGQNGDEDGDGTRDSPDEGDEGAEHAERRRQY